MTSKESPQPVAVVQIHCAGAAAVDCLETEISSHFHLGLARKEVVQTSPMWQDVVLSLKEPDEADATLTAGLSFDPDLIASEVRLETHVGYAPSYCCPQEQHWEGWRSYGDVGGWTNYKHKSRSWNSMPHYRTAGSLSTA